MEIVQNKNHHVASTFDHYLAGQLTEGTRRIYKTDILEFFCGQTPTLESIQSLSVEDIVRWRNEAWNNGGGRLAAATINRKLVALKSFYDLLVARGVVPLNPAHPKLVRRIKEKKGQGRLGITIDKFKELLEACRHGSNKKVNARDYALISLLYSCLLRRSEAHAFNWSDLGRDGGRSLLHLPNTKGGANDFVPIEKTMIEILQSYYNAVGGTSFWMAHYGNQWKKAPVFIALDNVNFGARLSTNAINNIVKKRANMAGITSVSAHTLRHTGITHLLMEGHSLTDVQTMARHSDPKQTVAYAALIRKLTESPGKTLAGILD